MSQLLFSSKTASLSPVLTSYDFLKTAAIVIMVIDHIGYFFYPEDMWLRAVGRLSAPIWFFLIGYAQSRDVGPRLWIGAGVLIVSAWVTGFPILPFNIIATMIAFRLLLDPMMAVIQRKPETLYPICFVFFLIGFPSAMVLEYGSTAMLLVMAGYFTRNRESLPYDKTEYAMFCLMAAAVYMLYQIKVFFPAFSLPQEILAGAGIMGVMMLCMCFRPFSYTDLTAKMPVPIAAFFRLCGRYSLEIYVLHLLAFKGIGIATGHIRVDYFSFHIF